MPRLATALVHAAFLACIPALLSAQAQPQPGAIAEILNTHGETIGTAELVETSGHGVLIRARFDGLPPGGHGFHIHETGTCTPTFDAAGDHHAPRGRSHGIFHEGGPHAGDLLNLEVPDEGAITVEQLAPHVTLDRGVEGSLFDADGSALVVHQGPDDYATQPSGSSGDPVACGVIVPSGRGQGAWERER